MRDSISDEEINQFNNKKPLKSLDQYSKAYSGETNEFFTHFNPDLIENSL